MSSSCSLNTSSSASSNTILNFSQLEAKTERILFLSELPSYLARLVRDKDWRMGVEKRVKEDMASTDENKRIAAAKMSALCKDAEEIESHLQHLASQSNTVPSNSSSSSNKETTSK